MTEGDYAARTRQHYSVRWTYEETLRWGKGPIEELPLGFAIERFARATGLIVYATSSMSQSDDDDRLELHLFAKDRQAEGSIVELLTVVAHFHRNGERLGLGHTVEFGRPWVTGSSCTHGLISLPYLDGPELEWMDEPRVRASVV
jgi:hypothetical protein